MQKFEFTDQRGRIARHQKWPKRPRGRKHRQYLENQARKSHGYY